MFEPKFESGGRKRSRKQLLFSLALAGSLALLSSCGSGSSSSSTSTPSIVVTCSATQVTVLGTATCNANTTNLSSTLVDWSISPSGSGSIVNNNNVGDYTAPATVPTNNVVTVTAASHVQSTVTGTATITIEAAVAIATVTCVDPVSGSQPSPLTVSSRNQLDCSATTSAGATVAVNWTVTNTSGGDIGSISTLGVYTAPLVPPPGQTVKITATSQAGSTPPMSLTATIIFGPRVLHDSYVFSTSGRLTNSTNSFFARVGSFNASNGVITGGFEDTNQAGTSGAPQALVPFTGSYSVGADGRGTMQFCENTTSGCPPGSPATSFFRIVVISPTMAQITDFSSPATTSASTTSGGEIVAQDPSVFGAGDGNLTGTYSFNFAGVSSSANEESAVGEFTANGHGSISAGGPMSPGEMDINSGGAQVLSASSYLITSSGRGTIALGGLNFNFYVVSASRAKFIEVDAAPASILAGDAYKQQSGVTCAWGLNVLNGSTVLETEGVSSGVVVADVGSFTASISGTTGAVSAGSIDENSGGTYTPPTGTLTGSYAVDPCGRGTLTLGSHSYVFYIISTARALLQETTSGIVAHGFLVQPQGGPFASGSLTGSYALRLSGTNAPGAAGQREDIVGQLTADGAGTVKSGSLDINSFGATQTGVAINGTYLPSPAGTLRATMLLSPTRNLVLYLVSPIEFYVVDTDATGTAIGTLDNQF